MSATALTSTDTFPPDVAPAPAEPAPVAAQAELIDAWWDEIQERVQYLMVLMADQRFEEALTLTANYLEGIAHALVSLNAAHADHYEDELEEHSNDPYLTLVHPLQLVRLTAQIQGLSPSASHGLAATFRGPDLTLLYKEQAVEVVRATLAASEAKIVERAIWRCTVAYVIYDFIRSQSFRRREGTHSIGLGKSFRQGAAAQGLSVPELVGLLLGMIEEGRARSHAMGMLPEQD